jgi:hypothetical protein
MQRVKTNVMRVVGTLLWSAVGWSAAGIVAGLVGLPSAVAFVGAIAAGMVVWFDPSGRLWARHAPVRRIRPIEEVAAELDARASGVPAEVVERT